MSNRICSHEQTVKGARRKLKVRPSLLTSNANGGEEAAGAMGFLAMTEKKTAMAGSAKIAEENIFVPQTGGKKLRTIGFRYVEANMFGRRLMPRRHHVQPLQRIGFFAGPGFIKIFRG